MKVTRDGDWLVTTPVYVGSQAAVDTAAKCKHEHWDTQSETVDGGVFSVIERCKNCVGVRSRWRPASAEEAAVWKAKREAALAAKQAQQQKP